LGWKTEAKYILKFVFCVELFFNAAENFKESVKDSKKNLSSSFAFLSCIVYAEISNRAEGLRLQSSSAPGVFF
jgi:hypothetical protein